MKTQPYPFTLMRGPRNKITCPACGRRSLVPYVGPDGIILHPDVGKCDHVHSCAYHRTPREYFAEHPDARERCKDWQNDRSAWLDRKQVNKPAFSFDTEKPDTIPADFVRRTQRLDLECALRSYLNGFIDPLVLEGEWAAYGCGITQDGRTIYWQFDIMGRCRGGKIVPYGTDGHRVKAEGVPPVQWVHTAVPGVVPQGWKLSQCLFGEHLLAKYPDKRVALVEAEKTALIAAASIPEYVWVATGGRNTNLERAKAILKDRRTIIYPDLDATSEWQTKFAEKSPNWTVSDIVVRYAYANPNTSSTLDLGDIIIESKTCNKNED